MNYIVDDINTVVDAMRRDPELIAALNAGIPGISSVGYSDKMPFYMFGHRREISNRLLEQGSDKVYKYQKYPLVALRLDIPEANANGEINFTLNIALLMSTNQKWIAPKRYQSVFKPILYPMYDSFLRQLKKVGKFKWEGDQQRPEHTKLDRPYWGTEAAEGNTANLFNDPLDAIELIDLKLSQDIDTCARRIFADEYVDIFE